MEGTAHAPSPRLRVPAPPIRSVWTTWVTACTVHGPISGRDVAVGDDACDGSVGVGEAVTTMGPALELLPAFVIGEGASDGDSVGRVAVAVSFPLFRSAG